MDMPLDKTNYILTAADVWAYALRSLTFLALEANVRAAVVAGASLALDVSAAMTTAFFSHLGNSIGSHVGSVMGITCTVLTANTITLKNETDATANIGIKAMCLNPV